MKKIILGIIIVSFLISCKRELVEKPEKFIDQETMTNILFDLAILDALKANQATLLQDRNIDPYTYIYKKYNIDSLQFNQNNKYYASDIKTYKKMYELVEKRLDSEAKLNDSLMKKSTKIIENPKSTKDTNALKNKRRKFEVNTLSKKIN